MESLYWLLEAQWCHKKGSLSFTLHWPNDGETFWSWLLLFSRWRFRIQSNPHSIRRSKENHFFMPIWYFWLPMNAIRIIKTLRPLFNVAWCPFSPIWLKNTLKCLWMILLFLVLLLMIAFLIFLWFCNDVLTQTWS